MIPRLVPPYTSALLAQAWWDQSGSSIDEFEAACAREFNFPHALFFPYGRSALYAFLQSMDWTQRRVLMPSYTCVVAPHAVSLSGNVPLFVDSSEKHFLPGIDQWLERLDPSVDMVLPTPVFGYSGRFREVTEAVRQKAPNAFVLVDLAHGFLVKEGGQLVSDLADGALLGLGASKYISSVYGGVLLLRDSRFHAQLSEFREKRFSRQSLLKRLKMLAYAFAINFGFKTPLVRLVHFLEFNTSLLWSLTDYYYGKNGPTLPSDVLEWPSDFQAEVGLKQLEKLKDFTDQKVELSRDYERLLRQRGFHLFESPEGTTFSHFPLLVEDREGVVTEMAKLGVQLGRLIDYSCAHFDCYRTDRDCPRALYYSERIVNLPNWPGLKKRHAEKVIDALEIVRKKRPAFFRLG